MSSMTKYYRSYIKKYECAKSSHYPSHSEVIASSTRITNATMKDLDNERVITIVDAIREMHDRAKHSAALINIVPFYEHYPWQPEEMVLCGKHLLIRTFIRCFLCLQNENLKHFHIPSGDCQLFVKVKIAIEHCTLHVCLHLQCLDVMFNFRGARPEGPILKTLLPN